MDDTISRAAVLDEIHKYMEERDYTIWTLYDNICEMPSAQQWIPCEERLPEPGVNVLVDVADIPAGDRFPLVDMIGDDGEWINCDGSNWLAVAWMPIPGPYDGEAT